MYARSRALLCLLLMMPLLASSVGARSALVGWACAGRVCGVQACCCYAPDGDCDPDCADERAATERPGLRAADCECRVAFEAGDTEVSPPKAASFPALPPCCLPTAPPDIRLSPPSGSAAPAFRVVWRGPPPRGFALTSSPLRAPPSPVHSPA